MLIVLSVDSWVQKYGILTLFTYIAKNVEQWLGIFLIKSFTCCCD